MSSNENERKKNENERKKVNQIVGREMEGEEYYNY